MSILAFTYIGYFKPFDRKLNIVMEIFNEGCVLICGYTMLCFTEWVGHGGAKFEVGWVVVIIVILNVLVNIVVQLIDGIRELVRRVRRKKRLQK